MSAADGPIADAEADALFAEFAAEQALVLAVSGGPDSTALLFLAAGWRRRCSLALRLTAVTVNHGLRPQARGEAAAVKRLAARLGISHRTLRWTGPKPVTGLQEKARAARYRLLHAAACAAKARFVLTAHTLDDQAETVLLRMTRGSGLAGLGGMERAVAVEDLTRGTGTATPPFAPPFAPLAAHAANAVAVVRPLIDTPKSRLIATLRMAGLGFADDPSNLDPRFARARLRRIMPGLAREGLTARRLARLAHRVRRSDRALDAIADAVSERLGLKAEAADGFTIDLKDWQALPPEIALRLLSRAITLCGNEGPVELGKFETLADAVAAAIGAGAARLRRTLAGAMVSLQSDRIIVQRAPARRGRSTEGVQKRNAALRRLEP